jgi:hypothetical protein
LLRGHLDSGISDIGANNHECICSFPSFQDVVELGWGN